mgnify:FL=1
MGLTASWGDTQAFGRPVICKPDHPLFEEIKSSLRQSDCWYKDETSGQIQCQNRMIAAIPWWAMTLDLSTLTEKNIGEWWFRIQYAQKVGFAELDVGVFGDEGWTYRPVTLEDLKTCIGLTTNVATTTRSKWLRRVTKSIQDQVTRTITNEAQ